MEKKLIYSLTVFLAVLIFSGCGDFLSDPNSDTNTGGTGGAGTAKITITYPLSNDTISYNGTQIQYTYTASKAGAYVHLYINGQFINTYPFVNAQPAIGIYLDKTAIGKTINYLLVYFDSDGTYAQTDTMKNILISEDRTPPSTPFNFKLRSLTPSSINLSWKDTSKSLTGFEIWRKEGVAGTFNLAFSPGVTVFNINDDGLMPDTVYFYKIRSVNQFGKSAFSEVVNSYNSGGSPNIVAPSNLEVIAIEPALVKIKWRDNSSNENFFGIERRTNFSNFKLIGFVGKNVTTFTDSANGLVGATDYCYRIKAFSSSDSSWSLEACTRTPQFLLRAPVNVTLTNTTSKNVKVQWTDNDPTVAPFDIERKMEVGGFYVVIATTDGNTTTYNDNTVEPGHTYYYRIRTYEAGSYSSYSEEKSIYSRIIPPPAPTGLFVSYYAGTGIMDLNWNYGTHPITKFFIERKNVTDGGSFAQVAEVDGTVRIYQDLSTLCQKTYIYRIKAYDGYASSPASNEFTITNTDSCD